MSAPIKRCRSSGEKVVEKLLNVLVRGSVLLVNTCCRAVCVVTLQKRS